MVKLPDAVAALRKIGFIPVSASENDVEQYYKEADDHLVTLEPIVRDGKEDWYVFSEEGKVRLDEYGMEYHERVGLSVTEMILFTARAYELRVKTAFIESREELSTKDA